MNTREQVVASIEGAKADLEQALQHLKQLPALDWGAVRYAMHAMGNYLNVSSACIHFLNEAVKDDPNPEVHDFLRGLERTTDLMAHVTRHLTHASAGQEVPLRREEVDLVRLARRGCAFYQLAADRKGIQIICAPEGPGLCACADRVAVATVLDNLLSNALKFSPPDKRIWVRVLAEPGHVVCAIQDEGPGLTPADQAKLFTPGARLTPAPTAGEPSTGYGLAIARDLIARMDGAIECESQPGQGATFSFRLPAYVKA